jgi:uncharacterized protein (DUF58 family)
MGRLVLLGVLINLLFIVGLASLNGVLLALAIPLLIYLASGLLFSPRSVKLDVQRTAVTERVTQNVAVTMSTTITNTGSHLEEAFLSDLIPRKLTVLEGERNAIITLAANEQITLQHTIQGKRGYYRFPPILVSASDHFNLFRRRESMQAPAHLYIMPSRVPVKHIGVRPRHTRVYAGQIPARVGGPGVLFYGIREYQTGDPLRWIDWKTTSRSINSLYIKQFEQERAADISLILDARLRSDVQGNEDSIFEYAVQATTALAEAFLGGGNRVNLLIYGLFLDWTFPGYGKIQRERILQALARAELGDREVFESLNNLPFHLLPSESQIVFISSLLPGDAEELTKLRARGHQVLVISPNPVGYAAAQMQKNKHLEIATRIANVERALILSKLRRAGIQALDWDIRIAFQQFAQASLGRSHFWQRANNMQL